MVVGDRCPECGGTECYVTGEYGLVVYMTVHGERVAVRDYEKAEKIKCRECNHEWSVIYVKKQEYCRA